MPEISRLDHVALVVSDLGAALAFWRDTLGLPVARVEDIPGQETQVALLPIGDSDLELVMPTTDNSGLARFLAKRGPGVHHISLQVADLDAFLALLRQRGVRLINEQPVQGAGGKRVAFIHPESANGVLVELCQAP